MSKADEYGFRWSRKLHELEREGAPCSCAWRDAKRRNGDGCGPTEIVIGIGKFDGRKRPTLYVGNEFCVQSVASFGNEGAAVLATDTLKRFLHPFMEEGGD